ncbi:MAG: hypothetical protein ACO3NJ_05775 [Candidatus Poseidoniaceae archaeon]
MQANPDSQPVGEIVSPPPSVQINSPQLSGTVQDPTMGQPAMQQNVVYIQIPKFKHPTRIYSSVMIGVGILVYILSTVFAIGNNYYPLFDIGYGTCCMLFNAAFVCEIVFYYNMMQHNQTYGQGTGWAVTNIVLAAILTVIGLFFALGILASGFNL